MVNTELYKQRLQERGMTISGWCRIRNVNYNSLIQMLAHKWGTRVGSDQAGQKSQEIYNLMLEDGLQ